jgi:hypothetical protein
MIISKLSSVFIACSGPGAMEAINENFWKSVLWAVSATLFVLGAWLLQWHQREKKSLLLSIFVSLLIAIHPAWTISAMVGDCGQAKLEGSKFVTTSIGIIFILQFCWWLRHRRLKVER